eukprot:15435127-Alexandrium_andersonii.AAC.1
MSAIERWRRQLCTRPHEYVERLQASGSYYYVSSRLVRSDERQLKATLRADQLRTSQSQYIALKS